MAHNTDALLDAFAEARRTWDELVGLQPDIVSAGGPLDDTELALLSERISAHVMAAVALEDAIEILRVERAAMADLWLVPATVELFPVGDGRTRLSVLSTNGQRGKLDGRADEIRRVRRSCWGRCPTTKP